MKHKHFTFDLDYFPITNSNVFQNIKIQNKNKLLNPNKIGIKRFSIKNELNFKEIPEIMFFEKSIKKPKQLSHVDNFSPSSNQTKKSNTFSYDEIQWSAENKNLQSGEKQKRVESCPKPSQIYENKSFVPTLKNQIKCINLIDEQKQQKLKVYPEYRYFQRNSHKKYQLESLQECQSEFDQSSQNSTIEQKIQCKTNDLRIQKESLKSEQNEKQMKKTKCTQSQKLNKSKKTQKSHLSKNNQSNPQNLSNKQRPKQRTIENLKQKEQTKITSSLFIDDTKGTKNKFISLNRKSYYVIGSKSNKHRSLNKDKKTKHKSLREEANVILTNGDITENSTSIPSSNCRNSSTSSTVNSKAKAELCKPSKQALQKQPKIKGDAMNQAGIFQIVKRTGEILNKYKGECIQLKKQKVQYQQKYEEALKKLNRIKEELDLVMKPE